MRRPEAQVIGLSGFRDNYSDSSSEASIFDVHGQDDFYDN